MIEVVRQWLTGVICAALMTALADGLMPKGAVRQVGKLVCALVLLCALLRPMVTIELSDVVRDFHGVAGQTQQQTMLEQHSGTMMKILIERRSAAYILDKAARIGLDCQVRVECRAAQGGIWLPQSVYITGRMDAGQQAQLTAVIRDELGIAPEYQVYAGGE